MTLFVFLLPAFKTSRNKNASWRRALVIRAYDPQANAKGRKRRGFPGITFMSSPYELAQTPMLSSFLKPNGLSCPHPRIGQRPLPRLVAPIPLVIDGRNLLSALMSWRPHGSVVLHRQSHVLSLPVRSPCERIAGLPGHVPLRLSQSSIIQFTVSMKIVKYYLLPFR